MTDIEIAQKATYEPLKDIAKKIDIPEEYLSYYGKNKAKVDIKLLKKLKDKTQIYIQYIKCFHGTYCSFIL